MPFNLGKFLLKSFQKNMLMVVIIKISVPGIKDEFEAYLPARQRQTAGI